MRATALTRLAFASLWAFALSTTSRAEPLQLDPAAEIKAPNHQVPVKPRSGRVKARHAAERAQAAPAAALLPTPGPAIRRDAEPPAGLPHQLQFGTVTVTPGGFLDVESLTRR